MWDWIARNLWVAEGLAVAVSYLFSWAFDQSDWWGTLDGRLKLLIYGATAGVLAFAPWFIARASGSPVPAAEDLVYVVFAAVLSLYSGRARHEQMMREAYAGLAESLMQE
jgi:hypothetical protein